MSASRSGGTLCRVIAHFESLRSSSVEHPAVNRRGPCTEERAKQRGERGRVEPPRHPGRPVCRRRRVCADQTSGTGIVLHGQAGPRPLVDPNNRPFDELRVNRVSDEAIRFRGDADRLQRSPGERAVHLPPVQDHPAIESRREGHEEGQTEVDAPPHSSVGVMAHGPDQQERSQETEKEAGPPPEQTPEHSAPGRSDHRRDQERIGLSLSGEAPTEPRPLLHSITQAAPASEPEVTQMP